MCERIKITLTVTDVTLCRVFDFIVALFLWILVKLQNKGVVVLEALHFYHHIYR